ncbi:hypothetical protein DXA92_07785 [Agathobaculum butyriciproducens]|nr:hypothetical protein DXA94_02680 [Agathobaculum butyriciproducens]RGC60837.1 hypothetical protein DXA92_07785 [Agathobaculum butyriciproducens]
MQDVRFVIPFLSIKGLHPVVAAAVMNVDRNFVREMLLKLTKLLFANNAVMSLSEAVKHSVFAVKNAIWHLDRIINRKSKRRNRKNFRSVFEYA